MPCTDPRDVTCVEEAFDVSTPAIQQWELELIWRAVDLRLVRLPSHADRAAKDESVPVPAIWRVIRDGIARTKDISTVDRRQIGINFEGKRRGCARIRVKVAWRDGYFVATIHELP